eukprot:g11294.t1
MRVARKQAFAVYCGVVLAALEVEIAQVRGAALRTSLLTKNKGKKMKKTNLAAGAEPDDPAPANKTNPVPANKTNPAPATPDPAPAKPASAPSGPAPAACTDKEKQDQREKEEEEDAKRDAFMSGLTRLGFPLSEQLCLAFASLRVVHNDKEVAHMTNTSTYFNPRDKVNITLKASDTIKEMSESLWGGENWCETLRKRMNKSGTWEVSATHVSDKAFGRWMTKAEKIEASKAKKECEVLDPEEEASLLDAAFSDLCCSKKQPGCCG